MECIEDLFPGCGIEPDPGVTDRHHYIQLTAVLRADDEVTRPALNRRHRIDGVQNQVEHDLLQLHRSPRTFERSVRDLAGNLVLEDAAGFVGPKVFVSGDTPAKAAGATQLLRLG